MSSHNLRSRGRAALFLSLAVVSAVGMSQAGSNWQVGAGQLLAAGDAQAASDAQAVGESEKPFEELSLRGRVVWLAEAMARRHGVKTVPEAATAVLALETAAGELYPLVEDIRGRGFRRDERLRKVDLELLVRRYRGAPVVQVVRVFEVTDKASFELDYWCDICAIAMYELKPCDCCQGPIELRRRVVAKVAGQPD